MIWAGQKAAREKARRLLIAALAMLPSPNDAAAREIQSAIELIDDQMAARDPLQLDTEGQDPQAE